MNERESVRDLFFIVKNVCYKSRMFKDFKDVFCEILEVIEEIVY